MKRNANFAESPSNLEEETKFIVRINADMHSETKHSEKRLFVLN